MLISTTAGGDILGATVPLREGLNLRGSVRGKIDPRTLRVTPGRSAPADWIAASDRDGAYLHGDAALWRVDNGRLRYAMPDLAGIHELYYAPAGDGGWYFADDFLEIARKLPAGRLDRGEVEFFIRQGRFRRGATYFRRIRRCPIGWRIVPSPGACRLENLYEGVYAEALTGSRTYRDFKEILESVCRVEYPGRADAVLLSGGWDSSLLAALLRRLTSEPFHAVTFRYLPAKGHNRTEIRDSGRIADHLGIRHHLPLVDFNAVSAGILDDLVERMPLSAHLALPFLQGTRSLPAAGIRRTWCAMKADALYNLGPTARLAPGQGKIDLVKRWYLSERFFETLPDVAGRAAFSARLATALGVRLANRYGRKSRLRPPANVNELVARYADSESYLALPERDAPVSHPPLPSPVSPAAVRGLLIDGRYHSSGLNLAVAHHAPAVNGLDPLRPFAAPSLALYFRPLRLTWRDVFSPKRFVRYYLRELFGPRAYREFFGRRARRPLAPGADSLQWRRELTRTRFLGEIQEIVRGLPEPWGGMASGGTMQTMISLYWFAETMRRLGRPVGNGDD